MEGQQAMIPLKRIYVNGFSYNASAMDSDIPDPRLTDDLIGGTADMPKYPVPVNFDNHAFFDTSVKRLPTDAGSVKFVADLEVLWHNNDQSYWSNRQQHSTYHDLIRQEEMWLSFSVMFPENYFSDNHEEIYYNFGGVGGGAMSFRIEGGHFIVSLSRGDGNLDNNIRFMMGPTTGGVWHDFVVYTKLSSATEVGKLTVWKDGKLARLYNPDTKELWEVPTVSTSGVQDRYTAYPVKGYINSKVIEGGSTVDVLDWNGFVFGGDFEGTPDHRWRTGLYKSGWNTNYNTTTGAINPDTYDSGSPLYIPPSERIREIWYANVKWQPVVSPMGAFSNADIYQSLDAEGGLPDEMPDWWVDHEEGICVYLKFDNSTDDELGNDVTLHNSMDATYVSGISDSAISLGNSAVQAERSYLSIDTTALLENISSNFTIAYWIKAENGLGANVFCNHTNSGTSRGIDIQVLSDGRTEIFLNRRISDEIQSLKSSPSITNGAVVDINSFNHFAWVREGTSLKCYYNFELYNETTIDDIDVSSINNWLINRRGTSTSTSILDDFRVYDTALSASEILDLDISEDPYNGPWHISNDGSDNNNGSEDFPFATVTHAHSVAEPGDEILLERGSIFYENFIPQVQGTASDPITFDVYGDENLPLPEICGGKVLTEWESIGNGLYKITDTGFPSRVNVMVVNNILQGLGTFPKQKGGHQITGGSGGATGTISDSINLSGKNFVGGEVVARKWQWVLDRGTITAHSGSTLSFTGMTDVDTIKTGWGYFVQNHRDCCTEVGDWCQEGDDIIMYFGANNPNDYDIKCSYHEQILFNDKDHNHFYNIRFTLFNSPTNHTNNSPGIATIASQGIKFFNCEFQFFYVIFYPDATNNQGFELNNCTILDTLNIVYFNRFQPQNHSYMIRDCVIDRTGLIPGAGGNGSASYSALVIPNAGGTEGNIIGNRILNTGYNGININGTKFTVDKNYISHANLTKDDGGGIYSYGRGQEDETAYPYVKADRRITNNIITNVFGAPEGRPSWFSGNPSYSGEGLYMDDNARQLTIQGNICFNNRDGLKLHNVKDIDVFDNIFYNNSEYQVVMPDDTITGSFNIRGINFSGNILYADAGQGVMHLSDSDSEFHLFGTFSNNYYMRPSNESNIISAGSNSYSLLEWKSNGFGYDQDSKGTPTTSTVSELALNDTLEHIIYPLERIRLDPDGMQVNEPFGLEAFTAEILLDDLGPLVPIPVDTFEIILIQTNGGMATGGGTYELGTSATLEAIPDTNWVFAGWEEGGEVIETDNPWIFPVTADRYVTPSFIYVEPPVEEYTVIATVNGSGAVSGSGVYESGSWVTLTATPSDGWLFVRWSNDLEDNPYSFTVTGDIALQAIFQPIPDPPPAYITVKGKFRIV